MAYTRREVVAKNKTFIPGWPPLMSLEITRLLITANSDSLMPSHAREHAEKPDA